MGARERLRAQGACAPRAGANRRARRSLRRTRRPRAARRDAAGYRRNSPCRRCRPCCCRIISLKSAASGATRSWPGWGKVAEETPAIDMPVQWTLRSAGRHARNPLVIYAALALAGTALIIAAVAPLGFNGRAALVAARRRAQIAARLQLDPGSGRRRSRHRERRRPSCRFFERIAEDETAAGLGLLQRRGAARACHQAHAAERSDCGSVARTKTDTFATVVRCRPSPAGERLSHDRRVRSRAI